MPHVSGAWAILAALAIVGVLIRFRAAIATAVFLVILLAYGLVWEWVTGKRFDD